MDKPSFTFFLPAGALAAMRPFRAWLEEQPTYRIAPAVDADPCDVVEFNTCLCPEYLVRTVLRLVTPHAPFELFLNLPVPEHKSGALFLHVTEQGVMERSPAWQKARAVTEAQWHSALAKMGHRRQFSLQPILFPGFVPA